MASWNHSTCRLNFWQKSAIIKRCKNLFTLNVILRIQLSHADCYAYWFKTFFIYTTFYERVLFGIYQAFLDMDEIMKIILLKRLFSTSLRWRSIDVRHKINFFIRILYPVGAYPRKLSTLSKHFTDTVLPRLS